MTKNRLSCLLWRRHGCRAFLTHSVTSATYFYLRRSLHVLERLELLFWGNYFVLTRSKFCWAIDSALPIHIFLRGRILCYLTKFLFGDGTRHSLSRFLFCSVEYLSNCILHYLNAADLKTVCSCYGSYILLSNSFNCLALKTQGFLRVVARTMNADPCRAGNGTSLTWKAGRTDAVGARRRWFSWRRHPPTSQTKRRELSWDRWSNMRRNRNLKSYLCDAYNIFLLCFLHLIS